jgi:muramoyltetrapeptide carboxypeptidase
MEPARDPVGVFPVLGYDNRGMSGARARSPRDVGVSAQTRFGRPHPLKPGDRVAVVAPAGPLDRDNLEAGLRILGERYEVAWDAGLLSRSRYLAGDDGRRGAELAAALADPRVRGVVAARGGYGSMRILAGVWPGTRPSVDGPGKMLVGFSDITALHAALQTAGRVSVHGPVVTQLGTQPSSVVERFFAILEDDTTPPAPVLGTPMLGGVVEGPLLGGNLSVLTRLIGTPWLPDLTGAVLLLEDVGERPYRIDRMWTHLRLAGVFERVVGLALGDFTDCEDPDGGYTLRDVLYGLVGETGLPSVGFLPIGHDAINVPVALGTRVRVDGGTGTLSFLEPAVA